MSAWHGYDFVVQMPHMAPGEKLSEVEFLKILAAYQWESIARGLGRRPPEIVNAQNERLYGSVIDVEVCLSDQHSFDILGEDVRVHVENNVRFYAKRFAEGLFVIDDREIDPAILKSIGSRADLRGFGGSWACMTNAFIARTGGNVRLKVFQPQGADAEGVPEISEVPLGIVEQGRVQRSGEIEPLDDGAGLQLSDRGSSDVVYEIVPESDLNGAGLVYFARYEAMMNYGERRFLCEHLELPVSTELVSYFSTERRRAYFFANASPADQVQIRVGARLVTPDAYPSPPASLAYRIPFKVVFRIDLYRRSDGVLMASSLVKKALNVPGNAKAVLAETERLLRHYT